MTRNSLNAFAIFTLFRAISAFLFFFWAAKRQRQALIQLNLNLILYSKMMIRIYVWYRKCLYSAAVFLNCYLEWWRFCRKRNVILWICYFILNDNVFYGTYLHSLLDVTLLQWFRDFSELLVRNLLQNYVWLFNRWLWGDCLTH